MAAALTLLLPLYYYTYSTQLLSTYYYYLLLLATNCLLLLLFFTKSPRTRLGLVVLSFAISYCSMFAKQLLFFCQISPLLSSPLLCFADDEIVQVHTLYGI